MMNKAELERTRRVKANVQAALKESECPCYENAS